MTRMHARSGAICLSIGLLIVLGAFATATGFAYGEDTKPNGTAAPATTPPTFDKTGPQPGDQLPDLKLRTLKGEPVHLADAWHGGPALIVTSSFTCPKSRSRWPEVEAISEKYGKKLNVVIVYVIEAHPVGSVCPYKGHEEVTAENQRDGILRKQPTTLDDRLDLAKDFKHYLRIDLPIYVDTLDNQAWKAFGAAPNKSLLVDEKGIVAARQGWFDGAELRQSIERLLANSADAGKARFARHTKNRTSTDNGAQLEQRLAAAGTSIYPMLKAVREENVTELAIALKKYPDATTYVRESHGRESTLLSEAVEGGKLKSAELLLQLGADINARTNTSESVLGIAALHDNSDMIELLLRHHADPNLSAGGNTPLHEAWISGHADAATKLIKAGAKEDFFSGVAFGKSDEVKASIAADPSIVFRPDSADRVPLVYAAANGQLATAKLLIENGAPIVDDPITKVRPPLYYAIKNGSAPMVKLLLDAGHSPDTAYGWRGEDSRSEPLLHLAIGKGDVDIVSALLARKPKLELRNSYSLTALHVAAETKKAPIVALLLKAGADVNAQQNKFSTPCGSGEENTPQLNTPLHFAAAGGTGETIKALLKAGAKIDAQNVHGHTPMTATIVPMLYSGIDPDSLLDRLEVLIESGADINARDKSGRTVLDHASEQLAAGAGRGRGLDAEKLAEVVKLLEKHGAKHGEPKKTAGAKR